MQLKHNLSLNCNLDPSILSILIMKQIYQSFVGKFCNKISRCEERFVKLFENAVEKCEKKCECKAPRTIYVTSFPDPFEKIPEPDVKKPRGPQISEMPSHVQFQTVFKALVVLAEKTAYTNKFVYQYMPYLLLYLSHDQERLKTTNFANNDRRLILYKVLQEVLSRDGIDLGLSQIRSIYTMMKFCTDYAFLEHMGSECANIEEWLNGLFLETTNEAEML